MPWLCAHVQPQRTAARRMRLGCPCLLAAAYYACLSAVLAVALLWAGPLNYVLALGKAPSST
jgi:hypothetical protein